MSETRGQDPLRRKPPTIDLPSTEFTRSGAAAPMAAEEGATAIEPVASTGLGSKPFTEGPTSGGGATARGPAQDEPKTKDAQSTESKTKDAKPPENKPPESKPSDGKPSESKPGVRPGGGEKPGSGAKLAPIGKPGMDAKATASVSSPGSQGAAKSAAATTGPGSAGAPQKDASTSGAEAAKPEFSSSTAGIAATPPRAPASPSLAAAGAGSAAASGKVDPAAAEKPLSSAPTATPETARSPASGIGRSFVPGLLGGLLGAGLVYGAMRVLPLPGADSGLGDRLTTLERRIAALPAGGSGSALEPRIGALEAGLRQAGEDASAARTTAEAASRQAAEALGRPAAAAADPGLPQAVSTLEARVDDTAKVVGANTGAIGELGTRLQALGTRTDEGFAAGTAGLQAAQSVLQGLRADLGAARTGATALEGRTAEGEKRVAGLSEDLARLSGELAKLSPAAVQAGLRVVVAGRLDDALRAGTPLGPALAALTRLGADAGSAAALQPYAETAPPSAGALAAEFRPLAAQLTAQPEAPAETLTDKLRRLFGKVVTVRAVGDGSGSDVPGLVARIEAALGRASLAEAAKLWDQLPDGAKRASADWAGRLKSRVAAEEAARRLVAQSLTALDAATR